MILNVSVTEYRHAVTPHEVGLTRDRHTVSILRNQHAPQWFSNPTRWQWSADLASAPGFQWYVDMYSEVTTQEPWNDIDLFFRRVARIGYNQNPQGALLYPSYPMLNIAAMASASEALAGWFCEKYYNWDLYVRPSRVTPDMIFQDIASGRLALVEIKSSGKLGNVQSKLTTEMIKLLKVLAPTKQLYPSRYYLALIMLQIADAANVNLTSLVLEEV